MKGIVKGIIIGVVIIIFGAAILITGLALSGWEIGDVEFEMKTYTAEKENSAIDITVNAGSLKTEFYDGDRVIIEYPVSARSKVNVSENNGTLRFETKLKRMIFSGTLNIPDTIVKLPQSVTFGVKFDMNAGSATLADGVYSTVDVDSDAGSFKAGAIECFSLECDLDAGTVNISSVTCNTFECDLSAGSIKVEKISASTTKIDVSAGSAKLGFTGDKAEYGISTKVSAGSCNADAQTGTTGKTIEIQVSAGSVNLSFNV